jgi:hypothetical protein
LKKQKTVVEEHDRGSGDDDAVNEILYRVSIRLFLYTRTQKFGDFLGSFERYDRLYYP